MRILSLIYLFASTYFVDSVKCEDFYHKDLKVFENIINHGILNNMAEFSKQNSQYNLIKCFSDVDAWMSSLSKSLWPWKMMDASGKFPHGLLRGNIYTLGQFDECLSINEKYKERVIKGKYCLAKVPLPSIGLTIVNMTMPYLLPNGGIDMPGEELVDLARSLQFWWGVCVPDSCTASDINLVLKWVFQAFGINSDYNNIRVDEKECSLNEPKKYTGLDTFAVLAFSTFGLLMLCSTAYDIAVSVYSKKKSHQHDLFVSFSLYTNTAKLVKINKSTNSLRCIHGIRMLSMYWVVLCHRFNTFALPTQNMLDVLDWIKTYSAMIIGGGSVSVDTFFVLSGLLLAYVFSNQHERKKSFNVPMFYLHRLFRLWPAMAALALFYMTLFKHLMNGPVGYTQIRKNTQPCLDNWWSTLLYIQNYVTPGNQCAGHLWYLAIDTQLYILSPILLIPIMKFKRIAMPNIIFWAVVAQATTATISYMNNWAAVKSDDGDYWEQYYMSTHTRATVWLIGFLAGYLIYRTKNVEIKINKFVVILLWLLALSIFAAVVFGVKPMYDILGYKPTYARDGTFNAFARSAWATAICWVIFACLKGYGGPINWFLSLRFWEILSRISYSMYLTHRIIQNLEKGSMRVPTHFMTFHVVYEFFGDLISSAVLAYIWVMAFESPFLAIEKFLFYPPKNNKTPPTIRENIVVLPIVNGEEEKQTTDVTLKS